MSECLFVVGDTRDVTAKLPDGSVDLVLTSPPFLALRSYLPADHPDKGREIGSEATPGEFLQVLLELTAEWGRVLAPHGSICIELGDTYSGSGGAGGDYNADGLREGQQAFSGSAAKRARLGVGNDYRPSRAGRRPGLANYSDNRGNPDGMRDTTFQGGNTRTGGGVGWPLDKSLCGIPHLYHLSLAYGRNLLTGEPSPAGQWRVRNVVAWCRPNPPVGALGDKFRPATSYLTIATKARDRWFDLDAVRTPSDYDRPNLRGKGARPGGTPDGQRPNASDHTTNPAGAPPLDWWAIPTAPYSGKTTSTRRERVPFERAAACGAERTTSPDCPVHADLSGQLPKALRDERAAERQRRTPRTDDRHGQGQLAGFSPTDPSSDLTDSSHVPTSEMSDPQCSPAAKPRSTAFRKTDPAPSTNPADTPCEETSPRTGDTPASPSSVGHCPGTSESRTSEGVSGGSPSNRTSVDTADTDTGSDSSSACTCSYWRTITESTSHYAVFPPALLERPIKAMCPLRVCTVCGEPSRRIVGEAEYVQTRNGKTPAVLDQREGVQVDPLTRQWATPGMGDNSVTRVAPTLGWTDCGHDSWRTGRVFDPFGGSGTTGLVATGHGRDALLIDIDARNLDLATDRVGPLMLRAASVDEAATWLGARAEEAA